MIDLAREAFPELIKGDNGWFKDSKDTLVPIIEERINLLNKLESTNLLKK